MQRSILGTRILELDLALGSRVTFVSDLHLDPAWPEKTDAFERIVAGLTDTEILVIPGDLFEFWLGRSQLRVDAWQRVPKLLEAAARRGVRSLVMHGNRDFQLGNAFERMSRARVVRGGLLVCADGQPRMVVMHGDELCTNDVAYQKSKRWLRSRPLKALMHTTPYSWARGLVARGRNASRTSQKTRDPESMLVSRSALDEVGSCIDADLLFGHVHCAASGELGNTPRHYYVLPEFESTRFGHARWVVGDAPRLVLDGVEVPWPGPLDLSA
ncbi:MAG: UDP-2,3-diacylglucosamine diphosphatase [Planctomycetes bacterium]|nr:UDP-2,3-diacylglucosamine diphosphatase [Planctomycetota bacterium]